MTPDIPWERQPRGGIWHPLPLGATERLRAQALRITMWSDGKHSVISAVELAQLPGAPEGEAGPQWHVSIAMGGRALQKRPKDRDVRRILRDFGMAGTEEDNHHPGGARHFWRPIDPRYRVSCECKATEATVVEPDGYTWTNPKPETGEECRGCEFGARFGKACPIHGAPT